jgi:PAS domain S-box-containing protein
MSAEPVRVLLVEDEAAHAELARRAFEARGGGFEVSVAETVEEARAAIRAAEPPDVVIADWLLPDGEGLDLLGGAAPAGAPVVIMTSHGNERVAVEAMRTGAVDYVVKSELALADLPHVVERVLRQRRIEDALGDLAAGTGSGQAFFDTLVLRLARALRVKFASVAEIVASGRVRTLARCLDGRLGDEGEYALDGTPCADALSGEVCFVRQGAAQRYPRDEALRRLGAQSYLGVALRSSSGQVLGLLNAVHDHPIEAAVRPETVLQVFAARACAELERMQAHRELLRQRVFAESVLDTVASLVMVLDTEGRIIRFNRACQQLSGWSEDEIRGRCFFEVLRSTEEAERVASAFERPLRPGRFPLRYESEWLTRANERRLVAWSNRAILDETGDVAYLIGTGVDVTDGRRLEADLRRAALEWRETFDGLPLGILVVDATGRVVRANRTAVLACGRGAWSELIDAPLSQIGPGEPWRTFAEMARSVSAGAALSREVKDPLTGRTWVVSATALAAESEGAGRVILDFQDVTETARLRERLRQNETMAAIGSVVAGVAHEVRNPLFSISATLDAFESRFGPKEGYARYLDVLRGEIGRLSVLMQELLDLGRPSRADLAACDLQLVLQRAAAACEPLAREKGVAVRAPGAGEPSRVQGDAERLGQVFQNLIENAIHFSPAGAEVRLSTRRHEAADGAWVECSIRDTGSGFAEADLPRLFEPFFTRRRGGTGLGLSIVRRIVYDHGGEVLAENHPEGGAVVRVRLREAVR